MLSFWLPKKIDTLLCLVRNANNDVRRFAYQFYLTFSEQPQDPANETPITPPLSANRWLI